MIETYLTLGGRILDLSALQPLEMDFLLRILDIFRSRGPYEIADRLIHGMENPLMKATGGVVTRDLYRHPLYMAVRDLTDRLGILQGEIGSDPGDVADEDPVADEWVPVSQAAELKGVTVPGLHQAIRRGDLITKPMKPGSTHLLVSRRSLDAYQPSEVRQRAGRMTRTIPSG